jgi:hypothetical protein
MISLPFQNNTFFDAGPNHDKTANVLNIQPVLPFTFGDWNIISRTIAPLIALPDLTGGALGDAIAGAPSPTTRSASVTSTKPFISRPQHRRSSSGGSALL